MAEMPELRVSTRGNRGQSHAVRALAADQAGIVSRAQLLGRAMSGWAIDRALRSGTLHRLQPGVYSVIAPELLSEDALLLSALFAAGPDAFLSHGTAAWRWEITPAPPMTIEVSAPHHHAAGPGITVHRHGVLRPGDIVWNGRFPTTSVTRTLLDLAAHYHPEPLLSALAEAEFHHDTRPDDILRTLRRGHPGSAALRAALDAHTPGYGQARSQLERRFRRLLIRHGIELPRRNQRVGPYTVDCLWPDRRVAVELDGRQHARPRQADADDDRDLYLRAHRYIPRRYGTKQVGEQPAEVLADLRDAFGDAVTLGYTSG